MIVVPWCIFSSVSFQSLTHNKIIAPSIMGFETVYILIQTVMVFLYGTKTFEVLSSIDNFLLFITFMIGFSMVIFILIYKKNKDNIYLLLLMVLIFGVLYHTLSAFMQLHIDLNDFLVVRRRSCSN